MTDDLFVNSAVDDQPLAFPYLLTSSTLQLSLGDTNPHHSRPVELKTPKDKSSTLMEHGNLSPRGVDWGG